MTQKNKIRVRRVPATDLRSGDMFFDAEEQLAKVVFRSSNNLDLVTYSCVDSQALPCIVAFERSDTVIKVTDPRAYAAREA
ncbi:hypothetical protein DIBBI_gp66 [Xanthomonas phage vB_XveM_DIBBI]|uniref:Uncharacterized protein n=1 Tax=Xanthomonas phage vB_XveM_DIBBI TaxID=1129194 RepID=I3PGZ9_9CAUD|nr:hypothetical protein DIBBI_gp66 [Xanthomonas phage vB_XveM_DIBBI]AEX65734.1 hypothetical protein DIBBI_066 [Xanthomonas phage vB_XveM_DIBBI]